jgi:hypothetical protein
MLAAQGGAASFCFCIKRYAVKGRDGMYSFSTSAKLNITSKNKRYSETQDETC